MTNGSVAPRPGVPQKKGLSPWAWVGIGCLGVLVIGGVIVAMLGMFLFGKAREVVQEMEDDPVAAMSRVIAAANPEVELVEADEAGRTVTFRNTETGEEFTFGYDDIEEGRVTFSSGDEAAVVEFDTDDDSAGRMSITTGEGRTSFGEGGVNDVPMWVPAYPGVTAEGAYTSETAEMRAGAFHFETADDAEAVLAFYAAELETAGLEVKSRTVTTEGAMAVASSSDEARTVTIACSRQGGVVEVVVNYTEKR